MNSVCAGDYETYLESQGGDLWQCLLCRKLVKRKCRARDHVESRHFATAPHHVCTLCGKSYSTKNSIQNHMTLYHKGELKYN